MNGTKTLYDRTSTQNVEYIGVAASGTDTTSPQWQIREITYSDDDNKIVSELYANGSADYAFKWSERTTITYS